MHLDKVSRRRAEAAAQFRVWQGSPSESWADERRREQERGGKRLCVPRPTAKSPSTNKSVVVFSEDFQGFLPQKKKKTA